MIKIEKSKYIRFCLTLLAAIAIVFLTTLCYFLGWTFEWSKFGICLGIIVAEMIGLAALYFALIMTNKSYYLITDDAIRLFNGNQEIFAIPSSNIVKIHYVKFVWIILMTMGAGYLHIEYTEGIGQIKPTVSYQNGKKIYSISMSLKQAKQLAKTINKDLQSK